MGVLPLPHFWHQSILSHTVVYCSCPNRSDQAISNRHNPVSGWDPPAYLSDPQGASIWCWLLNPDLFAFVTGTCLSSLASEPCILWLACLLQTLGASPLGTQHHLPFWFANFLFSLFLSHCYVNNKSAINSITLSLLSTDQCSIWPFLSPWPSATPQFSEVLFPAGTERGRDWVSAEGIESKYARVKAEKTFLLPPSFLTFHCFATSLPAHPFAYLAYCFYQYLKGFVPGIGQGEVWRERGQVWGVGMACVSVYPCGHLNNLSSYW